jgi:catechol 2,3-dioxygenase-like lactoylglutathione lyase family enzyme
MPEWAATMAEDGIAGIAEIVDVARSSDTAVSHKGKPHMTEMIPAAQEFHLSLRVTDLDASTAFYTAFFGVAPKERTARYSTFIVPDLKLNFVLLVNDRGTALDAYSMYHLGLGVANKDAVIESYHRARDAGAEIAKPPRTTWRGTPLHELWLRDPTGYLIEIYARLTAAELANMPADKEPVFLVAGPGE